jgi:hypothetical protein
MDTNLQAQPKFALVLIDKPMQDKMTTSGQTAWQRFSNSLSEAEKTYAPKEKLHDNVWLIDLRTSLPLLGDIIARAKAEGIAMRLIFCNEEPVWIAWPEIRKNQ